LKALANNSKIPGYKKDKTFHRKLFYKITKMVRLSIQTLCQCKTKQDLDSLNFLLTFKFGRAGRPKMPYQKTKVNNIIGYETYDDFLTRL
jgi:hypothetical protein